MIKSTLSESKISTVKIAAIDNGLTFPTHHPSRVRSYPYGWVNLPIAYIPFSKATADYILPYITSSAWWEQTLQGLEILFSIDPDFKPSMWAKQKSVIRGQGYNLMDFLALSRNSNQTAVALVNKPLVLIHEETLHSDEEENYLLNEDIEQLSPAKKFLFGQKSFKKVKQRLEHFSRRACFSSC
jgi:hypothetical protein